MFKRTYRPLFLFLIVTIAAGVMQARSSGDGLWREVAETSAMRSAERLIVPDDYRTFTLNKSMMRTILSSAPEEFSDPFGMSNSIITLPMPDGTFQRFRVEHSLVVDPLLVEKYPELGQTYRGQGIDDPTASVRFDLLPTGFHSQILSSRGTVMVDPYVKGSTSTYISYFKRNVPRPQDFSCDFETQDAVESISRPDKNGFKSIIAEASAAPAVLSSGSQLRTYRLALAATGEYTQAVGGGTVAGALSAQVVIMNRVNGVYERDLAIRMVIIANNDLIIYTNAGTDPFTNNDGVAMLTQNNNNTNTVINAANYDIGHVFSTGGGGIATIGGTCGSSKARGVTGLSNPTGDVFAIDFVAHEMGHQWGANHTFNSLGGNCGSQNQWSMNSAFEPGSGITIMGYAGICDSQDLSGNSIDTFHVKSLEDIIAFSTSGNGSTCGTPTATGNTPPVVNSVGGTTFNIPKQTPFTLTAAATDANGDTITYDWQQYDLGAATTSMPNSDVDGSPRPIFRVYGPTAGGSRTFPSSQFILANANVPPTITSGFLTGELLPSIARSMTFQVIARDNRANGGGVSTASVNVVVADSGPFKVNQPNTNTIWFLNSNPTVTWDVGGSSGAPINATNVRILLSTDGGATFPIVLADNTPNDGSQTVVSPAINTSTARIKVEAAGNIFFDVSDTNFSISAAAVTFASLGGRLTSPTGRGIANVYVSLTGGSPSVTRIALSNAFGYYQFQDVSFAADYTIRPAPRKGIRFNPTHVVRNHQNEALDVNFVTQ